MTSLAAVGSHTGSCRTNFLTVAPLPWPFHSCKRLLFNSAQECQATEVCQCQQDGQWAAGTQRKLWTRWSLGANGCSFPLDFQVIFQCGFFSKYYLTFYLLALLLSISINKDYANLQRHKIKTICFSSEAGQGWNTGKGPFLPPDSSLSATSDAHHQPTADICSERCV